MGHTERRGEKEEESAATTTSDDGESLRLTTLLMLKVEEADDSEHNNQGDPAQEHGDDERTDEQGPGQEQNQDQDQGQDQDRQGDQEPEQVHKDNNDLELKIDPHSSLKEMRVWSTDGLASMTCSGRLFERAVHKPFVSRGSVVPLSACAFELAETKPTINQVEAIEGSDSELFLLDDEKRMQRSWSAPPLPTQFDGFFSQSPLEEEVQHLSLDNDDASELLTVGNLWDPLSISHASSVAREDEKKDAIVTMSSPQRMLTPSCADEKMLVSSGMDQDEGMLHGCGGNKNSSAFPVIGLCSRAENEGSKTAGQGLRASVAASLRDGGHLYVGDHITASAAGYARTSLYRGNSSSLLQPDSQLRDQHFEERPSDCRNQSRSIPPFSAPPGFQTSHSVSGYEASASAYWNQDESVLSQYARPSYPIVPAEFAAMGSIDQYRPAPVHKLGGLFSRVEPDQKMLRPSPAYVSPAPTALQSCGSYDYSFPQSSQFKLGPSSSMEFQFVPVTHSYSSHSLLEEFKSASKADKWDLIAIKGHLVQFARDQSGSRFIQQKLEKADEVVFCEAFDEVLPHALSLMTDVFGNYVIQKFFDHGNLQQQRLLVELMTGSMIRLVLQTYGCRVIQKALEVCQPQEQLTLIYKLKGHVLKCVVDQNGNHVLQKCIEAASCTTHGPHGVTGDDIQFIVNAFKGQTAALSTHAYGCRVVQRVLEHCAPAQTCPLVNEIILKCRDLVKDQFGNYVVQHVITYGAPEQRDVVMRTIVPDIEKWSQHKYASNVVEACLVQSTKEELSRIIDFILRADDSGASCPLLPMMKHMYGNYVVQKLLDMANPQDRERMECIIKHNADYLRRFTYGKHVLSRVDRMNSANSNYF